MAHYDLIIRNGTIVDGTRTPRYQSDLAVKDGKIAKIGGLKTATADKVLDANGLIVAPGFSSTFIPTTTPSISGTPTAPCPAGTGLLRWASATAVSASPPLV